MPLFEGLKLPDILKASQAQCFALAFTCAAFIYVSKSGLLPMALEPWVLPLVIFIGILATALWIALSIRGMWQLIDIGTHWRRWRHARARRKSVESYIPHMTEDERAIIGYLLERNQKSFDCALDGGYATTLIARGIVVRTLRPGQVFDEQYVPMGIPDDVWDVLLAHRDSFPETYKGDGHPWRVHWMAR